MSEYTLIIQAVQKQWLLAPRVSRRVCWLCWLI